MMEEKYKNIKILNVVGARPNFMKIAPLFRTYQSTPSIIPILVHTNQHHDNNMSGTFFKSLGIPNPDYSLETNINSPTSTITSIMSQLEPILQKEHPDLVVVVGDVNSTLATAITTNKTGIKLAHIESGLRSGDRTMPEEINRILVDNISDMLFVTEQSGLENLEKENMEKERVHFVGNVMIDNLVNMLPKIDVSDILEKIGVEKWKFIVMTIHRPVNADSKEKLEKLIEIQREITDKNIKIVFPVHPRTLKNLEKFGLLEKMKENSGVVTTEPLDYIDFIKLVKESSLVLTDSGGIQEEAAYLRVPTITLRESTERPSTIESGANRLHSIDDVENLVKLIQSVLQMDRNSIKDIPLWDGKASERIVEIIMKSFK